MIFALSSSGIVCPLLVEMHKELTEYKVICAQMRLLRVHATIGRAKHREPWRETSKGWRPQRHVLRRLKQVPVFSFHILLPQIRKVSFISRPGDCSTLNIIRAAGLEYQLRRELSWRNGVHSFDHGVFHKHLIQNWLRCNTGTLDRAYMALDLDTELLRNRNQEPKSSQSSSWDGSGSAIESLLDILKLVLLVLSCLIFYSLATEPTHSSVSRSP